MFEMLSMVGGKRTDTQPTNKNEQNKRLVNIQNNLERDIRNCHRSLVDDQVHNNLKDSSANKKSE